MEPSEKETETVSSSGVRADVVACDKTEHKRAEEALRESQALLNAIVDSTSDIIWSVDPENFGLLTFNRGLIDYFSRRREIRFRFGMRPEDLALTQDVADQWRSLYQRALGEGSYTTEYTASGGSNILQLTFNLLRRDGKVFGISVFGKDITEHKRAVEALHASEERYRRLFEVESDAILVVEPDAGRILDANAAALELYGYTREEFLLRNVVEISAEPEKTRAALAKGQTRIPLRWHRKKDGTVFPVEITGNSFVNQERTIHVAAIRDITERKRAEEALQDSEERFRTLFENATVGIYRTTPNGQIVMGNPALVKMLRYDSFQELASRNLEAEGFQPQYPRKEFQERIKRQGEIRGLEGSWKRRDGTVIMVRESASAVRAKDGRMLYYDGIVEDITARHRAEEELSAARERLEFLLSSSPAVIYSCKVSGDFGATFLSNNVTRQLGYTPMEFVENPGFWAEHIHPEDRPRVITGLSRIFEQGHHTHEYRYLHKNGTYRWMRDDLRLIRNAAGHPHEFVGCWTDITEHKRAEEEREKFVGLVQNSTEFIGMATLEGQVFFVNPSGQELVGLDRLDGVKTIFDFVPKEEAAYLRDHIVPFVGRDGSWHGEFRLRHFRTGHPIPVWMNAFLIKDASTGQAAAIACVCTDLTERKRAEEERQRSLEQLRALAGRLQSIREEERTRVAREIHDQLGQALTAIKLDLSSLLRELPAGEEQPAQRTASILQLVEESIQAVRRISTELRPGILDDLGLVAAIEWAGEDFQARTGTTCRLDLPPEDIAADPERATAIFRIFQETLTNVARHADASEVEARLAREDGGLTLEIHDNGKGIPEDKLSSGESLGILGMRERAMLLGGEITIRGLPGNGTTVRVRIPDSQGRSRQAGA